MPAPRHEIARLMLEDMIRLRICALAIPEQVTTIGGKSHPCLHNFQSAESKDAVCPRSFLLSAAGSHFQKAQACLPALSFWSVHP